jgi:hypothetical protein
MQRLYVVIEDGAIVGFIVGKAVGVNVDLLLVLKLASQLVSQLHLTKANPPRQHTLRNSDSLTLL